MQLTRRSLIFVMTVGGAACGFTPVYGPTGAGTALQNSVSVSASQDALGFRVRSILEDRFGRAQSPQFSLIVLPTASSTAAAVTSDGDTTRFNLIGSAEWVLLDLGDQERARGNVETFNSYSATGSTVATQSAEQDARDRLAQALADLVASDLILALSKET